MPIFYSGGLKSLSKPCENCAKRRMRHRKSRISLADKLTNIPEVQLLGKFVAKAARNKPLLEEEIPLTFRG
jgi:hypothetical protein